MSNTLLITKEIGGYFSFVLNGNTSEKVQSIDNNLLIYGTQCHFKTTNGANIIKEQDIQPENIVLVAGGTFRFTSTSQLWSKLLEVGYFTAITKLDKGNYVGNADNLVALIDSKLVGVDFLGSVIPTDTPTGTNKAFWVATQAGTYTNFGGVVVSINSFAVISRNDAGVFSISQTELNLSDYAKKTDFVEDILYNKVGKRLLTESDSLDLVGSYSGNKVNTLTTNVFTHSKIKLKNNSKNYKASGWRVPEYGSTAGFSKTFNYSLSGYVAGDIINVRFFMRINGLTPVTNAVAKQSLTIGNIEIPIAVSNSETTITDVGEGWNKYVTRHVLTASDITQNIISSVNLIYYGSLTPETDSLEVAGMEIYFKDVELLGLKIDEIISDANILVPTVTNSNGKIVSNATDSMLPIGNNTNPFVSISVVTAEQAGLTDVNKNTLIYKGVGWKATEYSSYAGFKNDLSGVSLSSLASVVGDKLKAIYYIKSNVVYDYPSTHGFFIGTNKIDILNNTELLISDVGNGWKKYELLHIITDSDITQNNFVRFEWNSYGGSSGQIATQSIEITTPLIYINDLNLYGYYNDQSKVAIDIKISDLISQQRRWQGKKWYVSGDSITAFENYQYKVQNLCDILNIVNDGIPGQQLGTMANRMTSGNLADVDLVTIFGGTNDYGGNKFLGTISDAKTVDTFYGNIKNVIDKILTLKPTVQLVFFTPLKRGVFESQPVYPNANGAGFFLPQYVKAIKEVCELYSIPVLDLYSEGGFNEYTLSSYTVDNLHPNEAGFVMLAKKMSAFLEKL